MNTSTTTPPESTIWQGTPSQLINLPQYLLLILIFGALLASGVAILKSMDRAAGAALALVCIMAAIPLLIAAWKWLVVSNTRYELTTQRLRIRTGVLNRHLEELELYRVRDYKLEEPFFMRLVALSTVVLTTADKTAPIVVMKAIKHGDVMREQMRRYVEESRARKGVREVDLDSGSF